MCGPPSHPPEPLWEWLPHPGLYKPRNWRTRSSQETDQHCSGAALSCPPILVTGPAAGMILLPEAAGPEQGQVADTGAVLPWYAAEFIQSRDLKVRQAHGCRTTRQLTLIRVSIRSRCRPRATPRACHTFPPTLLIQLVREPTRPTPRLQLSLQPDRQHPATIRAGLFCFPRAP